ncbi:MAG: phage portal protein [Ruminococcus sp.]|nr:phage portal protein [Ruminococcus sp.]
MGLIQKMTDKIRTGLRNFIQYNPAQENAIIINEGVGHLTSCAKNRIWYWGKSTQLSELYTSLDVSNTMFWKAEMTKGQEIRKIHVALPALIVDTIANIVISDYNGIELTDKNSTASSERWREIEKTNKFSDTLKEMLTDLGIVGDGAFKISYDKEISDSPIIEWYPSERIQFTYVRGRIREVIFYTNYFENGKKYKFVEIYGYGYIKYELYNDNGKEISLNSIQKTSWIKEKGITFDKSYMWAVPVIYGKSSYKGRGKGFIEGKEDAFDSLDEVWSQWMDALRAGRTKTYIPSNLIPYDIDTGKPRKPNAFDNRFIELGEMVDEDGKSRIQSDTPNIQHDAYLSSYVTALDLCLQGVISPSTLGIDVKKLDNAEAQREKEKTTLYTRQNFVELLENVLPKLVLAVLNADNEIHKKSILNDNDIEVSVKFGEYANPSFESQVETVGKARQNGVMSIETSVDELYGDSKSEDWKAEEVKRIKEEQGIATVEEASEIDDIDVEV